MYCPSCGAEVPPSARFCPRCGASTQPVYQKKALDVAFLRRRIRAAFRLERFLSFLATLLALAVALGIFYLLRKAMIPLLPLASLLAVWYLFNDGLTPGFRAMAIALVALAGVAVYGFGAIDSIRNWPDGYGLWGIISAFLNALGFLGLGAMAAIGSALDREAVENWRPMPNNPYLRNLDIEGYPRNDA